jgi:hypothetical protein
MKFPAKALFLPRHDTVIALHEQKEGLWGRLGFIMVETVLLQRLHSLSRPTHLYTRRCPGRTVNLHGSWFLCFEQFPGQLQMVFCTRHSRDP